MDRILISFDHQDTRFAATISVDVPLSRYVVSAISPECQLLYHRDIPFDIVSNGLDYRTETDWDFMHALITALRAKLKSEGLPFV